MSRFGQLLAEQRRTTALSQHRLALAADTTQRHLSFLETGRSRPTREMIMRLAEALDLPPGQRADLFEAGGFTSPYRRRVPGDAGILEAMTIVERFVLANWPYPALAMTDDWDVVAANARARALFQLPEDERGRLNLFDILLDPGFRAGIRNWSSVGAVIYARLRRHARSKPSFQERLQAAVTAGAFGALLSPLAGEDELPVLLPIEFDLGSGTRFRMTSLMAQFTSAHDEALTGLEIELCLPLDDESDAVLRG